MIFYGRKQRHKCNSSGLLKKDSIRKHILFCCLYYNANNFESGSGRPQVFGIWVIEFKAKFRQAENDPGFLVSITSPLISLIMIHPFSFGSTASFPLWWLIVFWHQTLSSFGIRRDRRAQVRRKRSCAKGIRPFLPKGIEPSAQTYIHPIVI